MAAGERLERKSWKQEGLVAGRVIVVSSPSANLFSLSRCEETGANMRRESNMARSSLSKQ